MGTDRDKQWDFKKPETWKYLGLGVLCLLTVWAMGKVLPDFSFGTIFMLVQIGLALAGIYMTGLAALAIVWSFIQAVRSNGPS